MATITLVKRMALFMNVIVFLVGIVICVIGFFIRFNSGLVENDVITLFNYVEYNNVRMGSTIAVVDYFMIVAGGLLAITAVFGFFAAWKKIRGCLIAYVIIVIVMILIQATTAGLWLSLRGRTDQWLKGQMLNLLKDYDGHTATDEISKGYNMLFIKGKCCCVNPYGQNGKNDFDELPAKWWTKRFNNNIPPSCCQGVTTDTVNDYQDSATCTVTPTNYYTDGCYEVVTYYIDTFSIVLCVCAAVLLIVEVVAIICSCMLLDKTKHRVMQGGRTTKDQRPPPYVGIDAVMKKRSR